MDPFFLIGKYVRSDSYLQKNQKVMKRCARAVESVLVKYIALSFHAPAGEGRGHSSPRRYRNTSGFQQSLIVFPAQHQDGSKDI